MTTYPSTHPSTSQSAGHWNQAVWPEQVRLPGQAAALPGPIDLTMMYVMHHAFRRDLTAFAAAATATPIGDRVAWRGLAARWALFAQALHHHHSGEDAGLWPALLERTDDAGRATLEAMEAEHGEIDPILEACAAGFEQLVARGDEGIRAALAVRLVAARESLARHLAHEETDAIAIIQEVLTPQEWHEIERVHFQADIKLTQVLALVPWTVHGLPGPVRRELFSRTGRTHHLLWLSTRAGFERRERIAFRHIA